MPISLLNVKKLRMTLGREFECSGFAVPHSSFADRLNLLTLSGHAHKGCITVTSLLTVYVISIRLLFVTFPLNKFRQTLLLVR